MIPVGRNQQPFHAGNRRELPAACQAKLSPEGVQDFDING